LTSPRTACVGLGSRSLTSRQRGRLAYPCPTVTPITVYGQFRYPKLVICPEYRYLYLYLPSIRAAVVFSKKRSFDKKKNYSWRARKPIRPAVSVGGSHPGGSTSGKSKNQKQHHHKRGTGTGPQLFSGVPVVSVTHRYRSSLSGSLYLSACIRGA
jgi:hypothetical protein